MAVKAKKTMDKWRRKRFFSIVAPKAFQERELGQTLAYEPGELNGRCISANLMMLTGNIKRQHINMTFRIAKVQGDTGFTEVDSYEIVPAAIKRKVRRQKDRIDLSFIAVSKDNKLFRIKPMLITGGKVSKSVKSAVRHSLMHFILTNSKNTDYETIVIDIINEKFQRDVFNIINKITPIRSVDVRIFKSMGENTGKVKIEIPKRGAPVKVEAEEPEETEAQEEAAEETSEEPAKEEQ